MKYVMLVLYVPVDSGSSFFLSIFFLSLPVRLCVTVVSCDLLSRGVLTFTPGTASFVFGLLSKYGLEEGRNFQEI